MPGIKTHRDTGEASAAKELGKFLTRGRRWSFWIDVDHLTRAIDDYAKLGHLMRAKQAIEMRPANQIDLAFIGDLHRNVRESAITHRQRRHFADAKTFRHSSYTGDG